MAMIGQGKTRGQVAILDIDAAINQNCAAIILNEGVDRDYIYQQLLYRYQEIRYFSNSSGQQNLNADLIRSIKLPMPNFAEQREAGKLLTRWDVAIEKTEKLLEVKERQYSGLVQQLISRKNARHHWRSISFGDVVAERAEKTSSHDQYPVLTSARRGLFLQSEYFTKQVTSEDNTGYKVIFNGDFTYRSMSDDGRFIFNRLHKYKSGVISPAYSVFYASNCSADFLDHFLNSSYFSNAISSESQGGTRKALRFSAISRIQIEFPSRDEQERIANILDLAFHEVELEKERFQLLNTQKRGLMQKLLTGEWRVKAAKEGS